MFKAKKSQIQIRAKRLLKAFSEEARRQNLAEAKRKIIRASYENGALVLKEDFVRLPGFYTRDLHFQITNNLFSVVKNQLRATRAVEF